MWLFETWQLTTKQGVKVLQECQAPKDLSFREDCHWRELVVCAVSPGVVVASCEFPLDILWQSHHHLLSKTLPIVNQMIVIHGKAMNGGGRLLLFNWKYVSKNQNKSFLLTISLQCMTAFFKASSPHISKIRYSTMIIQNFITCMLQENLVGIQGSYHPSGFICATVGYRISVAISQWQILRTSEDITQLLIQFQ